MLEIIEVLKYSTSISSNHKNRRPIYEDLISNHGVIMSDNILIAIAWPYSNAEIHVGNITSSHLPGDIVARYHRLKGDNVLMVSGTDAHGTPVVIAADKEGKPVEEVYKK